MEKSTQGGVGLMGLLFVVFLVLKLTKVISWSWWWITAPLWGPVAIGLIIVIVCVAIVGWKADKYRDPYDDMY